MSRASALYRVCEAKFNAENAVGVGRRTVIGIIEKSGDKYHIFKADSLRSMWEKTRVIDVPSKAEKAAQALLKLPEEPSEPTPAQS